MILQFLIWRYNSVSFTDKDRRLGSKNSLAQRQKQQQNRRKKARQMFDEGMSKQAIADHFQVNRRTIDRDLKELEDMDLEEQADAQHESIIDNAPETTVMLKGKITKVKCILVGEDKIPTYWDAETYVEVFPDDSRD